jgi:O-acetyl-ADP-ribose deacetylase (regulator of RNase III)
MACFSKDKHMSNINIITGNIFNTRAQTIVNTVNCVGVMGAGIALECRLRYPQMFTKYQALCEDGTIQIGKLWLYKSSTPWILNFPTKKHWRHPSKEEYLHLGLQKFIQTFEEKGITSIAFPILGSLNGGIPTDTALQIMMQYLQMCAIPIEIYQYEPSAHDDTYESFRKAYLSLEDEYIHRHIGITQERLQILRAAMNNPDIRQLSQLGAVKNIGVTTIEKAYQFVIEALVTNDSTPEIVQGTLF